MCGIVGWVDTGRDLSNEGELITRMAETMRRRGPDAGGSWLSKHVAFGHRRLSVIDLENGQQPMVHEDGPRKHAIVYNGELYNFRQLRSELEAKGHRFRTRCDTEVVLHSYMEWGAQCVDRFDGIYAFGIWDEARQELFLARDPLGVKPLFWTQQGGALLFASELKALLANPIVPPRVTAQGLLDMFLHALLNLLPMPGVTPFSGVHELRPGHCLTFRNAEPTIRKYWSVPVVEHREDAAATSARIREMLEGSVRRQLMSDVPLACLLSGGIDSSAVTALARREVGELRTFAVDFVDAEKHFAPNPMRPERDTDFAEEMARLVQTRHRTVRLDTSHMDEHLLDIMRARDLPVGSQYDTSLYLLFRTVKEDATVALSGEIADEIFGGYPWFWRPTPQQYSKENRQHGFPWKGPAWFPVSEELRSRVDANGYIFDRYEEAIAEIPTIEGEDPADRRWREIMHLTLTRWLPYLLDRKDRMGMYASVEGRVPFCSPDLVRYAIGIPRALQMGDGVTKGLLRKAVSDLLPASIMQRKKTAYPEFRNPKYVAQLESRATEILGNSSSPVLRVFDLDYLKRLTEPNAEKCHALECFIQLDAWLREYRIEIV